jgi:short-subunit dehydrogenase
MRMSLQTKAVLWGLAGVGAWITLKSELAKKRTIDFRGKTVVITGGSRGLGLEMARLLAQEGANLALCARDVDELDRARHELQAYGVSVHTQPCDLTDKVQIDHFIANVQKAFGPIDVLINNAGIILVTPYENATEADFRESMETNFWAAFHMVNAVLPKMRLRKQGRIVNIASIGGKVAIPHLSTYSTSKFALVGYSEGLRAELLNDGIYVTTICPGLMRTGSPRNALFKGQNQKEYAAFKISDSIPLLTMSSENAARQVIEACRNGQAERLLSLPAKVGVAIQGVAPNLLAEVVSIVARLLPAAGGIGEERRMGKNSESALSESVLTTLTDKAAERNNENL